jgi:hypothetical protein
MVGGSKIKRGDLLVQAELDQRRYLNNLRRHSLYMLERLLLGFLSTVLRILQ